VFLQCSVGVQENDSLALKFFIDLVVYNLRLILRCDTSHKALTLGLRNTELLVSVFDILRQLFPRVCLLLGRAHEILDVVEIYAAEV